MSTALTKQDFSSVLPKQFHGSLNQELMDKINQTLSDPDTADMLRDNLIGYTTVMNQGKFKLSQYIDAVKYVSFKLMGNTNLSAYMKTFPAKYADWTARGVSSKDISSYVSGYNKSKLVNLIAEQSLVPVHVLNADVLQKAINIQASIMMDEDVSPKVRSDAANSLMTHLKRPETQKIELDVTHKEDSAIAELRATTRQLVEQQEKVIASGGMTAQEVAHSKLVIEGTAEEVTDV